MILALAALLRLYALGHEPFWCDEAYTALFVRLPVCDMLARLASSDDAPPLFYLLTNLNRAVLGDSEVAFRAVSVAAGLASVVVVFLWHRRRDARLAIWSAAVFAIAACGVFHARQARSYALLVLLATVLVLSCSDLLLGRRRAGPLLAISGVLLCLTHHVGVALVFASLLAWLLGARSRPRAHTWLLWHAPALATWAGQWFAAREQLSIHAQLNAWTGFYWRDHPMWLAPFLSLAAFTPGGLPFEAARTGLPIWGAPAPFWNALALASVFLCAGTLVWRFRTREVAIESALLFLPLLILLAGSMALTPAYVLGHTDLIAYPAFVLLVGRALARMSAKGAVPILILWLGLSLVTLAPSYGHGSPPRAKGMDRRIALEMVARGLGRDDWVIHTSMSAPSCEYYLERAGAPHRVSWFPGVVARNPASNWPAPLDSLNAYRAEADVLRRTMEAAMSPEASAWIFAVVDPSAAEAILEERAPWSLRVDQIGYPTSALVYALRGAEPVTAVALYTPDWLAGQSVLLRVPRSSWVSITTAPHPVP